MSNRRTINDTELQAIVRAEIANCGGDSSSQLVKERAQNLDYYLGRPVGTEIADRSQVVSTDVADTIEWILPVLIRIFTSGDAVEFLPETQSDVPAAKQATEYVNFIWNRDNPGFLTFYSWFKDALISKNGVIKIYWDKTPATKRERYFGLDDQTFANLVADKNVEVSEHTENEIDLALPNGSTQPITTHDVVITRTTKSGKVCVEAMPPEEFLISRDARNIPDARCVAHKRLRTLSDLIEQGFSASKVNNLVGDEDAQSTNEEEIARNTVEQQGGTDSVPINNAMRQVWVTEAYIKVDVDGDGIAEMRKVTVAGSGDEVLENIAWDMPRPFANLTPIIMPHRFYGRALADLVRDLQLIKTTIFRQYLDNLYLQNNQREEVLESAIVEPSEVLSSTPGVKIRVKQMGSIVPIVVPPIGEAALEGLNYIDQIRENRTGVSPRTQGMGVDNLHDTASGERLLLNAAMGKIELIARVFAETGVKDAFRMILRLICEYQDKPRMVRLNENWVPMDPRSWNADMDMEASVAISAGDRDQQLQHGLMLFKVQDGLRQLGMVQPEHWMNTLELLTNAMGLKGPDRFASKPQPDQQQAQDPKAAAMMAKVQADSQHKMAQLQIETQQSQQQMAIEAKMKQFEAFLDTQLKKYQVDNEIKLKAVEIQADKELRRQEIAQAPHIAHIQASAKPQVRLGGSPG